MTYMMIPYNHPKYTFPLNLEDRIRYVEFKFNKLQNSKIKFSYKKGGNGIFMNKRDKKLATYEVSFSYDNKLKTETQELLKKYEFKNKGNKWTALFE